MNSSDVKIAPPPALSKNGELRSGTKSDSFSVSRE